MEISHPPIEKKPEHESAPAFCISKTTSPTMYDNVDVYLLKVDPKRSYTGNHFSSAGRGKPAN
jgi:hypothetical protein